MTASSSAQEITSLIQTTEDMNLSDLMQYSDTQTKYLVPINTNSYSQQIIFDTRELLKSWWCPSHSYLALPVKISSSTGTAYTSSTVVSFRQSVLDLISGVLINLSGSQIVNSTSQMFYNNLRLRLEHDFGWRQLNDNEYCGGIDMTVTPTGTEVGRILPTNVVADNAGLRTRVRGLKSRAVFNSTTNSFDCVFEIPLEYIHTVFQQLDFPIINSQLQLTFLLNTTSSTSGSQYPPVGVLSGVAPPVCVVAAVAALSEPRLYYNEVYFKSELGQKLASMLESGISKKLYFFESDLQKLDTANTTSRLTKVVSPSVIAPNRMWLFSPATTAWEAPACDALVGSVKRYTSVQASINNTPIFNRPLQSDFEVYSQFKDEFPNVGSDISPAGYSYDQWRNGNSVVCVNFSKHSKDKLVNGNSSCSVAVDILGDTTNVDYYAILERKKSMLLNMSVGGTTAIIGDGF